MPAVIRSGVYQHIDHLVVTVAIHIHYRIRPDADILLPAAWQGRVGIEVFMTPGVDPFAILPADAIYMQHKVADDVDILVQAVFAGSSEQDAIVSANIP